MMMMCTSIFVNASTRQVRQLKLSRQSQLQRSFKTWCAPFFSGGCNRIISRSTPTPSYYDYYANQPTLLPLPSLPSSPLSIAYRRQSSAGSNNNNTNGESSSSSADGNGIVESTAATTQWKRSHYQKLEDKFNPPLEEEEEEEDGNNNNDNNNDPANETYYEQSSTTTSSRWALPSESTFRQEKSIDDYEDVQPMWKAMEGRVTKRVSLTMAERGGLSGRRNVKKSEEDLWLEAGVYGNDDDDDDDDDDKKSQK